MSFRPFQTEETTTPITSDDELNNTFTSYSTKFYKPLTSIKTEIKAKRSQLNSNNFPKFSQYLEIDNDLSFISNTSTLQKYTKTDQSIEIKPTLIKKTLQYDEEDENPYLIKKSKVKENFDIDEKYYKNIVLRNRELEEDKENIFKDKNNILGNWDSILKDESIENNLILKKSKKIEDGIENKIEYCMVPKLVESAQVSKRDCFGQVSQKKKSIEDLLKFEYSRTLSDKQRCMTRDITQSPLSPFNFIEFEDYKEKKLIEIENYEALNDVKKNLGNVNIEESYDEEEDKYPVEKKQFSSMFDLIENREEESPEKREIFEEKTNLDKKPVFESNLENQKKSVFFDRNTFGKNSSLFTVKETPKSLRDPNPSPVTPNVDTISTNKLVDLSDFYFPSIHQTSNKKKIKNYINPKVMKTSQYLNQKNWCIKKQCFIYSFFKVKVKKSKKGSKINELIRLGERRDLVINFKLINF